MGENGVNARVAYAGVGINLRTERPAPSAVTRAVTEVLDNPAWKQRARKMQEDLGAADAAGVAAAVVERALKPGTA